MIRLFEAKLPHAKVQLTSTFTRARLSPLRSHQGLMMAARSYATPAGGERIKGMSFPSASEEMRSKPNETKLMNSQEPCG